MFLEACISSPSSVPWLLSSPSGPCTHLEICAPSSLPFGGLTPPPGVVKQVIKAISGVSAHLTVLIRPRGGNFVYSPLEKEVILSDLRWIVELEKVSSVSVCSILQGSLDSDFLRTFCDIAHAHKKTITINRGIDELEEVNKDVLHEIGVDRILTSSPRNFDGFEGIVTVAGGVNADYLRSNLSVYGGLFHGVHTSSWIKKTATETEKSSSSIFGAGGESEIIDSAKLDEMLQLIAEYNKTIDVSNREALTINETLISPPLPTSSLKMSKKTIRPIIDEVLLCASNSLAGKGLRLRRASSPADVDSIIKQVNDLAEYEKALHEVKIEKSTLIDDGCMSDTFQTDNGDQPIYYCILVESETTDRNFEAVGFGFFFFNYSTWTGRGLYLEDLHINHDKRGLGGGKAVMKSLAKIALKTGCERFTWQAIDWNKNAFEFYESIGASVLKEWITLRMTADGMLKFAHFD